MYVRLKRFLGFNTHGALHAHKVGFHPGMPVPIDSFVCFTFECDVENARGRLTKENVVGAKLWILQKEGIVSALLEMKYAHDR